MAQYRDGAQIEGGRNGLATLDFLVSAYQYYFTIEDWRPGSDPGSYWASAAIRSTTELLSSDSLLFSLPRSLCLDREEGSVTHFLLNCNVFFFYYVDYTL